MKNNIAFISDIHSNLEALEAVLDDIDKKGIKDIYCLGDIVGYGANPNECIETIKKKNIICIQGNHDYACLTNDIKNFRSSAAIAAVWTNENLEGKSERFLAELKDKIHVDDMTLVHGTLENPIYGYMDVKDTAKKNFGLMGGKYCLCGHTHTPIIFKSNGAMTVYEKPKEGILEDRMIINAGSVGQPRDGDSRAGYLIIKDGKWEFQRVSYDIEKAADKILKAKLPEYLAERLRAGK